MKDFDIREMSDSREVLETKEPAALRWFLSLAAMLVAAIVVALFVLDKDTFVTAQGIIQPSEAVGSVMPTVNGKVDTLEVADGQQVQAGDVLFTLDTMHAQKQRDLAQKSLEDLEADEEGYKLLKRSIEENENLFPDEHPFSEMYKEYALRLQTVEEQYEASSNAASEAAARQATVTEGLAQQRNELQAKRQEYQTLIENVEASKPYEGSDAHLKTSFNAYNVKLEQYNLALTQARDAYSAVEKAHEAGQATKAELETSKSALDSALNAHKDLTSTYLAELYGTIDQLDQQISSLAVQIAQTTGEQTSESSELSTTVAHLKAQELVKVEAQIMEAESARLAAQAQIVELDSTLENSTIKAAATGTVMFQSELMEGTVLQAGLPVMSVVPDTGAFEITFSIPEKDRSQVQEGDPLLCAVNSLSYQEYGKFSGEVTSISATSIEDEQTGTAYYRATGTLHDSSKVKSDGVAGTIRSGMVARVDVISGSEKIGTWLLKELNFLD